MRLSIKTAGKSLLGGAMIIAGTTVGAGMFSLPVFLACGLGIPLSC
ncbi:tryptophan permease [Shewanella putrefaciens]|nr:tryptophan permease [Shewanella putrefaciens]